MSSIYDILGVEKGCSSAELKEAFLVWKKNQQEILKSGKPDEQKEASDRITAVTVLYRKAVKEAGNAVGIVNTSIIKEDNIQIKEGDRKEKVKLNHLKESDSKQNYSVKFGKTSQYDYHNNSGSNKVLAVVIIMLVCLGAGGWFVYDGGSTVKSMYYKITGNYPEPPVPPMPPTPKYPEPPQIPVPQLPTNDNSNIKAETNKSTDSVDQNKNKVNTPVTDEDFARKVFIDYNNALGNHNFDEAYNLMSPNRQKSMGTPSNFAAGYADTLESKVSNMKLIQTDQDEMVFDYVLEAKDKAGGNRILYQTFTGQVHMFKVNGQWKVGYSESKKISEMIR